MAKRKIELEAVGGDVQVEVGNRNVQDPVADPQESHQEAEQPAKEHVEDSQNIPEYAKKILAGYPNYRALYIDTKGGTFTEGTQPNLVNGAILYQNPFYKQ